MIYAVFIFVVILSTYALGSYIQYTLPSVEAGPTIGVKHTGLQKTSKNLRSAYTKDVDGRIYKYRRFIIQGICMTKKRLYPNDIISVRIFSSEDKSSLKSNDIALIFLNDDRFRGYKIRIVENIQGNEVKTFYYDEDGNKKPSSKSHSLDSILGIVDMDETQRNMRI